MSYGIEYRENIVENARNMTTDQFKKNDTQLNGYELQHLIESE